MHKGVILFIYGTHTINPSHLYMSCSSPQQLINNHTYTCSFIYVHWLLNSSEHAALSAENNSLSAAPRLERDLDGLLALQCFKFQSLTLGSQDATRLGSSLPRTASSPPHLFEQFQIWTFLSMYISGSCFGYTYLLHMLHDMPAIFLELY